MEFGAKVIELSVFGWRPEEEISWSKRALVPAVLEIYAFGWFYVLEWIL